MKRISTGAAALMLSATPLLAGGIERAPQSLAILFEPGNYVEFSAGRLSPDLSGRDVAGFATGDIAPGYNFGGFGYKRQLTDALSAALIVEQPFGADLSYASPADGGSPVLGGTRVKVRSTTYTALLRYKMDSGFGVHGGLRGSRASGEVTLNGLAYGPVAGYTAKLDDTWGWGYVLGVNWEKPEIAARVSLTYNSPIKHDFDTSESAPLAPLNADGDTDVRTPRSWTLEGQTGVAPDTIVFGSIRWVKWSEFKVEPERFTQVTGGGLVELDDSTTYTLGVGRKFTDNWSGAMSFTYEKSGNKLVSPLAPTAGRKGVSLAAIYTQDKIKITTGVSYIQPGEADPETGTPDTARARLRDGEALGFGIKVGYTF